MKGAALAATSSLALTLASPMLRAQDRKAPEPVTAREGSDDGAFTSFSFPARVRSGAARLRMGYDTQTERADALAEAVVPLWDGVALRAGAVYDALGSAARPFVLGQLGLLDQSEGAPLSLAAIGGFQARGFNGVPQIELGVAFARRTGAWTWLANVRYGQGLEWGERSGSASVASLLRAMPALQLGADSQLEADLERDADEPVNEPDWRLRLGPLATATYDVFAVSAGGGVTALRYRLAGPTQIGGLAYLGVGAVF